MFKAGINDRGEVYIEVYGGGRHYCPMHVMDVQMARAEASKLMAYLYRLENDLELGGE